MQIPLPRAAVPEHPQPFAGRVAGHEVVARHVESVPPAGFDAFRQALHFQHAAIVRSLLAHSEGAGGIQQPQRVPLFAPVVSLPLAGGAPVRALAYRRDGAVEKVADFARDVDALTRRRASPVEVARRWARVDPELCLNWLYQAIAAEVRDGGASGGAQSASKTRSGRLQNGAESLNIEHAFGDLRKVGELKRLQGRGLNAELQLSGILTRWYGARSSA